MQVHLGIFLLIAHSLHASGQTNVCSTELLQIIRNVNLLLGKTVTTSGYVEMSFDANPPLLCWERDDLAKQNWQNIAFLQIGAGVRINGKIWDFESQGRPWEVLNGRYAIVRGTIEGRARSAVIHVLTITVPDTGFNRGIDAAFEKRRKLPNHVLEGTAK